MKIFNPKITQGGWKIGSHYGYDAIRSDGSIVICYGECNLEPYEDDLRAICAIPELLKVLEAAIGVDDACLVLARGESYFELDALRDAINELNEKHGTD